MALDLSTLIAALGGSAAVAAGVGAVVLKMLERMFDHKLRGLEEATKLELDAYHKKTIALFEKQIIPLKTIVALAYKSRNLSREITEQAVRSGFLRTDSLDKLIKYHGALVELIMEERAVIPNQAFVALHEMKNAIAGFVALLESNFRRGRRDDGGGATLVLDERHERVRFTRDVEKSYQFLSHQYEYVAKHIQEYLGVNSSEHVSAV